MKFSEFSERLFKQSQILPTWIGAIFVQLQQTLMYVGIANIFMIAVTLWYTAGHDLAARFVPFITAVWQVLIILVLAWAMVILINWKYIIPAKQRHTNSQAVVHENPMVTTLNKLAEKQDMMCKDMIEIKTKLGIEELPDDKP